MTASSTEAPIAEIDDREGNATREVEAWRVFDLGDDLTLLAPFRRYWPHAASEVNEWRSPWQVAKCVAEDHEAPVEDCTCGIRGTEDLSQLLAIIKFRSLPDVVDGTREPILSEKGLLARVRLSGRVLPGVAMPLDDPFTTWRAERATLVELHLPPTLVERAEAVAWRYIEAPVFTYAEDDWPHGVPAAGKRHEAGRTLPKQTSTTGDGPPAPRPQPLEGVAAWTVFDLGCEGELLDRFTQRPCYSASRVWPASRVRAVCIVEKHSPPADGCTCGVRGVEDVGALFSADSTGAVFAKVDLWGRRVDVVGDEPNDYSPTTLRAARATLLELHVESRGWAHFLADRYPDVGVFCYQDAEWPSSVTTGGERVWPRPEAVFLHDVRRAGFGWVDTGDPEAASALLELGRSTGDAIRKRVSSWDAMAVLFHCGAEPTQSQVENLFLSAVTNLAPECQFMLRTGYEYARPITKRDALERRLGRPVTINDAIAIRYGGWRP